MTNLDVDIFDTSSVTWAKPGESYFRVKNLDNGVEFIAGVTFKQTAIDLDNDGEEDCIHAETIGRMVDEQTGETVLVGGRRVVTGVHNSTLYMTEAEDQGIDVGIWISEQYEKCIPRIRTRKNTLLAVSSIPTPA